MGLLTVITLLPDVCELELCGAHTLGLAQQVDNTPLPKVLLLILHY